MVERRRMVEEPGKLTNQAGVKADERPRTRCSLTGHGYPLKNGWVIHHGLNNLK